MYTIIKDKSYESFTLFIDSVEVSKVHLSKRFDGLWIIESMDTLEEFQRKGYMTLLMIQIKKYLDSQGTKEVRASLEGSGSLQILKSLYGSSLQVFDGNVEITDYNEAVYIMDVVYGTLRAVIKVPVQKLEAVI